MSASLVIALLAASAYIAFAPPQFTSRVLVQVDPPPAAVMADNAAPPLPLDETYLNSQRAMLLSRPVLITAATDPAAAPNIPRQRDLTRADVLAKQLEVEVDRKQGVMSVRWTGASPDGAAAVANAVADSYLAQAVRQRQALVGRMLEAVATEQKATQAVIASGESRLRQARQSLGAAALDEKNVAGVDAARRLGESLLTAQMEQAASAADYQQARKQFLDGSVHRQRLLDEAAGSSSSAMSGDGELGPLRQAIAAQEQKLENLRTQYLPEHPQVKSAQSDLDHVRAMYVVALQHKSEQAQLRVEALKQAAAEAGQQSQSLAVQLGEYNVLLAEQSRLRAQDAQVQARMAQLQAEQRAGTPNIRLLERAVPASVPSSPRPTRAIAVALVAGLLAGLGAASIAESRRRRPGRERISVHVGPPLMAKIPRLPSRLTDEERANLAQEGRGPLSEACGALRWAMRLADADGTCRSWLVTGCRPAGGTSTIATNLAIALARCGERVALVDGNTRRPCIHRVFHLSEGEGLVQILAGQSDAQRTLQHTQVNGLDVLPAGPDPEGVPDVLGGRALGDLLDDLGRHYDRIIVDSPPVTCSSDALVLAAWCDATILVTGIDGESALLRRAAERLCGVGARVAGHVVNEGIVLGDDGPQPLEAQSPGREWTRAAVILSPPARDDEWPKALTWEKE